MIVQSLLHINIRVPQSQLASCRDFYCNVLGLAEGARPPFTSTGFWLYAGDSPIVHLVASSTSQIEPHAGHPALNHIAFACLELRSTLQRLKTNGIAYSISKVPVLNLTQVNLTDPAGVGIELSFGSDEETADEPS